MTYEIKKVKTVSRKEYKLLEFYNNFCVDEKGSMYLYIEQYQMLKLNLNQPREHFSIPGYPMGVPLFLEDGMIYNISNQDKDYIIKTDRKMQELFRIELKEGYSRNVFLQDHHIYFTVKSKKEPYKTVLRKITEEGELCWEYKPSKGDIGDRELMPLGKDKVLVGIMREQQIVKFQILNKEGIVLEEIRNHKWDARFENYEVGLLKDNEENICIYSTHDGEWQEDKVIVPFTFEGIILDREGKEKYRMSTEIFLLFPLLFLDGKYIYGLFLLQYFNNQVLKIDLTNEKEEIIHQEEEGYTARMLYRENEIYLSIEKDKKTLFYCYNKKGEKLWEFELKAQLRYFEVKGEYLYFTTKKQIGIYHIIKKE